MAGFFVPVRYQALAFQAQISIAPETIEPHNKNSCP